MRPGAASGGCRYAFCDILASAFLAVRGSEGSGSGFEVPRWGFNFRWLFFFNSLFWVLVYGRRHCVADIDLGSLLGLFLVCGFLVLGCDDRSRVFLVAEEMLEK